MKIRVTWVAVAISLVSLAAPAQAYEMAPLTYKELFDDSDLVVIATPVRTIASGALLKVDQPPGIQKIITTVDTEFKVALVLKGDLDDETLHLLHLSRTDHQEVGVFGAPGTFFIDFEAEKNKKQSYILFMKKHDDDTFVPAWRLMEGSRAIIAVPRDGDL